MVKIITQVNVPHGSAKVTIVGNDASSVAAEYSNLMNTLIREDNVYLSPGGIIPIKTATISEAAANSMGLVIDDKGTLKGN